MYTYAYILAYLNIFIYRVYLNVLVDLVLSAFVLLWLRSVYMKLCFRLCSCLSIVSESLYHYLSSLSLSLPLPSLYKVYMYIARVRTLCLERASPHAPLSIFITTCILQIIYIIIYSYSYAFLFNNNIIYYYI